MTKYNANELQKRDKILQTHHLFGDILDKDMLNGLVYLFDKPRINEKDTIRQYIDDERKLMGLGKEDVLINSEVYGHDNNSATLYLEIKKNNKDFIHMTLHLTLHSLHSKDNGMIHIVKDIYKISKKKQFYALIFITRPKDKVHSLIFSIPQEYRITPDAITSSQYDNEVQQEMDVFISVLNHLFDENDKHYVGNLYISSSNELSLNTLRILYPIHPYTNVVLQNMNKYSTIKTRINKGVMPHPPFQNEFPAVNYIRVRKTRSKKKKHNTRKILK